MPTDHTFQLNNTAVTVGRDPSCDIPLRGVGVSRLHARIHLAENGPIVEDCGSSFGTRINNMPIQKRGLHNDCVVSFGVATFRVHLSGHTLDLEKVEDTVASSSQTNQLLDSDIITIGRDTTNSVSLSHPLVSRFHCTVEKKLDGGHNVTDNGSTNGTFVNGKPVTRGRLEDGDILQVGPFRFLLESNGLVQAADSTRIRLEAYGLSVQRGREKVLQNVSLSIAPGEFVGILGPSGAGKSSLALALTGQIPAHSGGVYYNGFPLKRFQAAFNSSIGYVSQHDMLRPELTVWETLWEQSFLRLPRDSMNAERIERINEVLGILDATLLRDRRISKLSGGEAKRIHLGVELLSSPTILFLDEPLAGLDAGLIHRFMGLFRSLCERGHTLLLTTHTLEQIDLCNRIVFLNSGRVLYDGPPSDISARMSVDTLATLYEQARQGSIRPETPNDVAEGDSGQQTRQTTEEDRGAFPRHTVGIWCQLAVLIPRYTKIAVRDKKNLLLVFAQAPLIAVLLGLVFKPSADFLPISFYFCITISAIWMGGVNSVRELAREWLLFHREYRIGLSPLAFLVSKIAVFACVSVVQASLFATTLRSVFSSFELTPEMISLIVSASVGGSFLGLCISAFSGNTSRAVSLLPIVFIPQIFFSGILVPFDRMPEIGRTISHLTFSRPVFTMFKKHFILDQSLYSMNEWRHLALLAIGLIILAAARIYLRVFTKKGVHGG